MMSEVGEFGNTLSLARRGNPSNRVQASDLVIHDSCFTPADPSKRPYGWTELRNKRVYAKEKKARDNGVTEEKIKANRIALTKAEETGMVEEVKLYGFVLNHNEPVQAVDVAINSKTFDPKVLSKRPLGWGEVRTKRVLMREMYERKEGATEQEIIASRPEREKKASRLFFMCVMCSI